MTKTAKIEGLISIELTLTVPKKGVSANKLREKVIDAIKSALYDLPDIDGEPYADEYQTLSVELENE
jgi:hypothetical protein